MCPNMILKSLWPHLHPQSNQCIHRRQHPHQRHPYHLNQISSVKRNSCSINSKRIKLIQFCRRWTEEAEHEAPESTIAATSRNAASKKSSSLVESAPKESKLLADIRAGTVLRKTERAPRKKVVSSFETDLHSKLQQSLDRYRKFVQNDEESDGDDAEWD